MRSNLLYALSGLLALLLLGGCAGGAMVSPSPPASPAAGPALPPGALVDGWTGALQPLCPMAQFPHFFRRSDGEEYGLQGATPEVKARIEALLCQSRVTVKVWGRLETEAIDHNGRRIVADRIAVVEAYPPLVPEKGPGQETVEGWQGRVYPYCPSQGPDDFFERQDGMRFGITAEDEALKAELMRAACEGYPIRIWGTLHKGADDYRGTQIVVERAEKSE